MRRVTPRQVVDFIDQIYPDAKRQSENPSPANAFQLVRERAGELTGLIDLVDRLPEELLTLDQAGYSLYAASVGAIRDRLEFWRNNFDRNWPNELGYLRGPIPNLNPLTHIRISLSKCHDSAPASNTPVLTFIKDDDFRESLRTDISESDRALMSGERKAATVLAGSIIEALLLWALQREKGEDLKAAGERAIKAEKLRNKPPVDLTRWDLVEYIEIAREMEVISKETAEQSNLAREFRNFIHPGRSQRLSKRCNRATALSAASGVEHVITDLEKKYA
jgi:hypothetical protein